MEIPWQTVKTLMEKVRELAEEELSGEYDLRAGFEPDGRVWVRATHTIVKERELEQMDLPPEVDKEEELEKKPPIYVNHKKQVIEFDTETEEIAFSFLDRKGRDMWKRSEHRVLEEGVTV